jgi:hypothetical protein
MAQITTSLYKQIADAYALIDGDLSTVASNARVALDAIVDVTTAYGDPSQDADAALEIELALLTPFNLGYAGAQNIVASTSSILDAVRAVNNHIITNTSGTDTSKVKLDTFVNSVSWDGGSVPGGWSNLSTDAGYTTTDWT